MTDQATAPVAYLHTLHMEHGQIQMKLTFDPGDPTEDEPHKTGFGTPGRDFDESYSVTTTPLFAVLRRAEAELPADVIALVIAAREAWEALVARPLTDQETARNLDAALERFSERVPYDDQPESENDAAAAWNADGNVMQGPLWVGIVAYGVWRAMFFEGLKYYYAGGDTPSEAVTKLAALYGNENGDPAEILKLAAEKGIQ